MGMNYDFSGWATRANLLCSDGRIIRKDAFKHNDGQKVPLVWNHQHNNPEEVLGHAILENREDGVYAYCTFNSTPSGKVAKELVQHGDVNALSIYANKLKQQGANVIHGVIREVSLVLAGANPGASIDSIMMHGDDSYEEGYIYTDEFIEDINLVHADNEKKGETEVAEETKKATEVAEETKKADDVKEEKANDGEETVADIFATLSEKQKNVVYAIIGSAFEDSKKDKKEEEVKHADNSDEVEEDEEDSDETVADVFNTLTKKQKDVVYAIIGKALGKEKEVAHSMEEIEGGDDYMKHNVFDQEATFNGETLSHSEMAAIIKDAETNKRSLRDTVLAHGITDLDVMFPDHKALSNEPEFIKRDMDWVAKVLGGVHHTPFSRIKTIFADITPAEARAKGYQKGNLKIEEVFKLLKRITNPTTVYKKQKLDRDDVLDITDFNILPWLKGELRMMLNEELARAIIIGDGRDPVEDANDKINEECIRPIWKMEELFTVKVPVEVTAATTGEERARKFINAVVRSRKLYKGSGNPAMFMPEDLLTECLLLEDKNGRVIYETEDKLRARLRVSEIIAVPVMEGAAIKRTDDDGGNFELAGLYVNLKDYNVGTDKGGEVNFFDDFDIDYNQMKYLMETRCSGSLIKPYSAVAVEFKTTA